MVRWATTWQLPRRSTVTGTCSPASVNTRVIPIFCAITPERMSPSSSGANRLELDLDVDAGRKVELHQGVDGLRRRIDDVEQTLVRAHLELLAALLVDVRRAVHRELLDLGRQRNRATDLSARALGRVDDLARRRIEDAVIKRLEPDPDILAVHVSAPSRRGADASAPRTAVLLDDAGDDAGADGTTAFTNGEAQLLFHRDRHDQRDFHRDVVAGHHHLGAFRQRDHARHVGGAEVELRAVVGEERRVAAAFLLGEDVGLGLELGVRLDRTRLAQHLAALDFLALGAAQERADIVAGLALVEQLAEHLDAGDDGLLRVLEADDLD